MEKIVENDEGRVVEKVVETEEWHKLILGWSKAVTATLVALVATFVVVWLIVNCLIRNECAFTVEKVTLPFLEGSFKNDDEEGEIKVVPGGN